MTDRCDECGASTTEWSCEELYHRLLALDHQREQPWGSYHGVNVACYLLQHSSAVQGRHRAAQLKLVSVFCDEGLAGLHALTEMARSRNSHRATQRSIIVGSDDVREPPPADSFTTTIHDVAVDGSFPAASYGDRMQRWAQSVRAAWG